MNNDLPQKVVLLVEVPMGSGTSSDARDNTSSKPSSWHRLTGKLLQSSSGMVLSHRDIIKVILWDGAVPPGRYLSHPPGWRCPTGKLLQ